MSRLRIAVVGLNFGRHIVKEIVEGPAREEFELAAVCDLDRAKAEGVAAACGCRAYGSLDELLADASIPTIGLFTGPVGRAGLIERILDAGRDVMTTKPFELDAAAAWRVLAKAERLGRGLRFRNGAVGSVFASFCIEDGDIYRNSMALNFERGTVYRNTGALRRETARGRMELALVMGRNDGGSRIVAERVVSEGSGAYQWGAFARAVRGERLGGQVTRDEIVAGLRIVEAMREAELGGGTAVVRPAGPG
ncbi:MAG: Inositol 2-dehydrogenase/D-chiro-inositol 3-dehydrogenase [Lentisphaerae bacterium ADurb.BinA184]|nr:MAG: Inositol 2-dehydrogenase/D-chiro-inositol 3-dehydrogenase [Lentisphaerae bacterium ADurb.BinA184]